MEVQKYSNFDSIEGVGSPSSLGKDQALSSLCILFFLKAPDVDHTAQDLDTGTLG